MEVPNTMKAWQYSTITKGLENSLKLNQSVPLPKRKANQHLVKVDYVSLNPVDYKPAENVVARRVAVPNPATPGIDFSGTVVEAAENSPLKPGDRVFGCGPSPFAGGMLAEYAVAGADATASIPQGLSLRDASTIGVAGLTAYQTIVPYKPKHLFINGGSGGTGVFGIQIAKALGYEVTTTCSQRNIDLCRSLGADEVIDYTKGNLAGQLAGKNFDHIVDNIFADSDLYYKAHTFSTPSANYVLVGGSPSLGFVLRTIKARTLPSFLGGGQRKMLGFFAKINSKELEQIAAWMVEGKVKAVVDETFNFEDAPKAFEKLKTSRAKGKIVVKVGDSV